MEEIVRFFVQQLVNGISIGSQYALFAVGYGIVYQVLGLMHFAHGDTLMFASFVAITLLELGAPLVVVTVATMAVAAAVAVLIERGIYRPLLRRRHVFLAFIGAIGAGLLLRNIVSLIWGNETMVAPEMIAPYVFQIGGIRLANGALISIGVAVVTVVAFQLFLDRTRHGQAILAVAQDRDIAAVVGIPERRLVSLVYALSGAIGMIGALMSLSSFRTVTIGSGFRTTLVAFVAAILGGIGTVRGAVAGGLALGILEAMIVAYVSTTLRDAIVFTIVGAFLILRPHGLMGRKETVRV
jgi:branched-chain amino acid transport system permease protein